MPARVLIGFLPYDRCDAVIWLRNAHQFVCVHVLYDIAHFLDDVMMYGCMQLSLDRTPQVFFLLDSTSNKLWSVWVYNSR